MFDNKLEVKPLSHQQPTVDFVKEQLKQRSKQTVENRTDITFNKNERNDIDYKGYRAYLYQFDQVTEVQDKELYGFIISAPTIDDAIGIFMQSIPNEGYYQDAIFDVEVIAIDLKTDRTTPWVMEY